MAERISRKDSFLNSANLTSLGGVLDKIEGRSSIIINSTTEAPTLRSIMVNGKGDGDNPALVPDARGFYRLLRPSPSPDCTLDDIRDSFSPFGDIKELFLSGGSYYIAYSSRDAALAALAADMYVKPLAPQKRSPVSATSNTGPAWSAHSQGGQDLYISNLSVDVQEPDLWSAMHGIPLQRVRVIRREDHAFAFAHFANIDQAKRAMEALSQHPINGKCPTSRLVRDRSKARILEEGASTEFKRTDMIVPTNPTSVHISHIPITATQEDVVKLFTEYGGAGDVTMKATRDGRKLYARVNLRSEGLVRKAVQELNGTMFLGCSIYVAVRKIFSPDSRPPQQNNPSPHMMKSDTRHNGHGHRGHHGGMSRTSTAYQLAHKVNVLASEVLDNCGMCQRVQSLIDELETVLREAVQSEHGHSY